MTDSPATDTSSKPRFYTISEVADILQVNERTVRRAISQGLLPTSKVLPGAVRIPAEALDEYQRKGEAS